MRFLISNAARLVLILAVAVIGCDEIVVEDIRDKKVKLLAPADGLSAQPGTFTFWWTELEYAEKYQLIVVKPSLSNPGELIVDTVISKTQFAQELEAGSYEWCVRAVNSGYKTEYSCRVLELDE